ncbi:hypothetical protein TCAL_05818 [Tigriopus californicus]|uniref:RING-type domain-containing protein n=1 Tax=Tigriopus californicus TaxID=6832 RepID=A0A553P660_TIGCA|nr:E3 ubiquitin-protein ligase SIAH1B-like [Tigriopus californicus]TRY73173.1 hypothetical protein TCAL_05818 [Tigriopus californicus]
MVDTSSTSNSQVDESIDNLKAEVECPICQRVPRKAPVYQCKLGHLLCQDCYPKCQACPVCRTPLSKEKIRSILADKILMLVPRPCEFNDDGCQEEFLGPELDAHEAKCRHRWVCCVDIACGSVLRFHALLDHTQNLELHAQEDFRDNQESRFQSFLYVSEGNFQKECMWVCDRLKKCGFHFYRESYRTDDGCWQIWVVMAGTQEEAKRFQATIEIFTEDEILTHVGPVNYLPDTKEKLLDSALGLLLTDRIVKRFLRNDQLHYRITIREHEEIQVDPDNWSQIMVQKSEATLPSEQATLEPESRRPPSSKSGGSTRRKEKPSTRKQ